MRLQGETILSAIDANVDGVQVCVILFESGNYEIFTKRPNKFPLLDPRPISHRCKDCEEK